MGTYIFFILRFIKASYVHDQSHFQCSPGWKKFNFRCLNVDNIDLISVLVRIIAYSYRSNHEL